jgi:hypothetical protein
MRRVPISVGLWIRRGPNRIGLMLFGYLGSPNRIGLGLTWETQFELGLGLGGCSNQILAEWALTIGLGAFGL